jgi:hypothetical protein
MSIVIENDIVCFLSEKGSNNFFYPTSCKAILKKGSEIKSLPWLSGQKQKFSAYITLKSSLIPLSCDNEHIFQIMTDNKQKIIIWIKPSAILLA